VKWIEDRREHLMTMGHAREMDCDIEIACRRDGTILGLRGSVRVDEGAYMRTVGTISPRNVAQFMSGPYRVPAIHLQSSVMLTNKAPIGTYRGPGRYEADFFRERLFDIVADADRGCSTLSRATSGSIRWNSAGAISFAPRRCLFRSRR
jgi:carbon-monoxide dehydrogenase large subunit